MSVERLELTECGDWPVSFPDGFTSGVKSLIQAKAEGKLAHLSSIGFDGMRLAWAKYDQWMGNFELTEHMSLRPIDALRCSQRLVLHKLYQLAKGAGIALEMLDWRPCTEDTEEELDPFGLEDIKGDGYV